MSSLKHMIYHKIYFPIHNKSWSKVKLGPVGVNLNISQNDLASRKKSNQVIICPNSHESWPK